MIKKKYVEDSLMMNKDIIIQLKLVKEIEMRD
jgi:hypothetical protein